MFIPSLICFSEAIPTCDKVWLLDAACPLLGRLKSSSVLAIPGTHAPHEQVAFVSGALREASNFRDFGQHLVCQFPAPIQIRFIVGCIVYSKE